MASVARAKAFQPSKTGTSSGIKQGHSSLRVVGNPAAITPRHPSRSQLGTQTPRGDGQVALSGRAIQSTGPSSVSVSSAPVKAPTREESMASCLTNLVSVDTKAVNNFAESLRNECQKQRAAGGGDIAISKEICAKVTQQIIAATVIEAEKIITEAGQIINDPKMNAQEKEAKLTKLTYKLTKLTYMSQSLIALTGVQGRFGGYLNFHCLPHSNGVANDSAKFYEETKYEFAAFCAGANHDAVMDYQGPPAISDPANPTGKDVRAKFHAALATANQQGKSLGEFADENIAVLKPLTTNSDKKETPVL